MKILVLEDDVKVARFLCRALVEEGFAVDTCARAIEARHQAQAIGYDLLIVDWMLPDQDGLSVCRALRSEGFLAPILMLTARGEVRERVLGLEAGADDYLVKPFEVEELIARIHALLRRAKGYSRMVAGLLELDRGTRVVTLRGRPLELTSKEYALLFHLLCRSDKIVTRSELLSGVWRTHFDPGSNLVEVHMSRLRDKLGDDAWMIETVRGFGYRLCTQKTAP